jgi:hypothetical protein
MTPKVNSAITEFHKWFTLVGIPFLIALQLTILSKIETVSIQAAEHEIDIKYNKKDISELQQRVNVLMNDRKYRTRFKQTDEEPQ